MAEAPRFTPAGVRVGSMPTPEVRAAPNALGAIGEAIGTLGRTAQRVMDRREQEAKIQENADETAGQDAFLRYKQDTEALYGKFKIDAVGGKVANERQKFGEALSNLDAGSYTAGLSEGAVAAFRRRAGFHQRDLTIGADTIAHSRVVDYSARTAQSEIEEATDSAAMRLASGNDAEAAIQIGRAGAAASRLYDAAGVDVKSRIVPAANLKALKVLTEQDYTKAAAFYSRTKGKYGDNEADAARMAQTSTDRTWADAALSHQVSAFTDSETGLVDWEQAHNTLTSIPDTNPDRIRFAQENLSKAMAAEDAKRKSVASLMRERLRAAYAVRGAGSQIVPTAIQSTDEWKSAMRFIKPEDAEKISQYSGFTDEGDKSTLLYKLNSGDQSQVNEVLQEAEAGYPSVNLSADDLQFFQREVEKRRKAEGGLTDRVQSIVRDFYKENSPEALPKVVLGKRMKSSEMKKMAAFNDLVAKVEKDVADSGTDKTDTQKIKALLSVRMLGVDQATGGLFGGDVTQIPASALPAPTPEQEKKYPRPAGFSDPAYRLYVYSQQLEEAAAKAEAPVPRTTQATPAADFFGAQYQFGIPNAQFGSGWDLR